MVLLSDEDREFVEDFIDGKAKMMIFVVSRQDTRYVDSDPKMVKAFVIEEHAQNYIRDLTDEHDIEPGMWYWGKDDEDASYAYGECRFEW